jgi:hypothetical protein
MPEFRVALLHASRVRPTDTLIQQMQDTIAPLAAQAGKDLVLWRPETIEGAAGADITLRFVSRHEAPLRLGEQFIGTGSVGLILGDEGGGNIYVGALEEFRVGGRPERYAIPSARSRVPGVTGLEPPVPTLGAYLGVVATVFSNGEPEFAQFAANVALHEFGHVVASLEHTTDISNYMVTGRSEPFRARRTLASARRFWSDRKTFNEEQVARLVANIAAGTISGGASFTFSSLRSP